MEILKSIFAIIILLNTTTIKAQDEIPVPTPAQITWQDCEVGVLFHFDMSIAAGDYTKNNASKKVFDPKQYNPKQLDTDQWIAAAKAVGAKYAIFTATHFNGFMQWQSDLYPYGLKQSPWRNGKGDIVGDFVTSCRKAGIKPGIYISTHRNFYQGLWGHFVDWGTGKGSEKQEIFNRLAEKMTEEICSKYGELIQIWYDAGVRLPHEGGPDVLPIFDKYQPNSVFYNSSKRLDHRWIGNEAGHAGYPCWATITDLVKMKKLKTEDKKQWYDILYHGDSEGTHYSPAMVDVPLRGANGVHNWFWTPNQEHGIYSTEKLIEIYYNSVGHNSNLILGVVINPDGLVPETDEERLKEFGEEIKCRFSNPLGTTSGSSNKIVLKLQKMQPVNQVVLMEDINHGERVRNFIVQGKTSEGWKTLTEGSCIGHKFITTFDEVAVSSLRLEIETSVGEPVIKEFSVFNIVDIEKK
ncbi:MAG: alpha-L-fucosidase [Bacteroidota bacterium]